MSLERTNNTDALSKVPGRHLHAEVLLAVGNMGLEMPWGGINLGFLTAYLVMRASECMRSLTSGQ